MHGDHVGVSLDEEALVLLHDGLLGKVDTIEFATLVVDFRLGRIDIFGHLGVGLQHTSSEGYDLAR